MSTITIYVNEKQHNFQIPFTQLGSVEEIKGHIKELFSTQYPLMLYPYQVFEKKRAKTPTVFCYCTRMCKTCAAKLVFMRNEQGLWDLKRHNLDHSHNLGQ